MNLFTYCIKENTKNMFNWQGRVSCGYCSTSALAEGLLTTLYVQVMVGLGMLMAELGEVMSLVCYIFMVFVGLLFALRLLFIGVSLHVRRLHDLGYSGLLCLFQAAVGSACTIFTIMDGWSHFGTAVLYGHDSDMRHFMTKMDSVYYSFVALLIWLLIFECVLAFLIAFKEGEPKQNKYGHIPLVHMKSTT